MTQPIRTALRAVALVVALFGTGCKDHSHDPLSADDPETRKAELDECVHDLDIKEPVLVKECLDKQRVTAARIAEAKAILQEASTARGEAITHLKGGNPEVLAMLATWAQAKASDPTLFVGVYINNPEPAPFGYGSPHTSVFDANEVANELRSLAKDKLPGVDFGVGNACTGKTDNLDFDATITVHDSGQTESLDAGKDKSTVYVLAYDFEIVACYGDQRVTLASLKDQAMPLPDGLQLATDAQSGNGIAQLQMDRKALYVVQGVIENALGLR